MNKIFGLIALAVSIISCNSQADENLEHQQAFESANAWIEAHGITGHSMTCAKTYNSMHRTSGYQCDIFSPPLDLFSLFCKESRNKTTCQLW
jgi:hypothetical protein